MAKTLPARSPLLGFVQGVFQMPTRSQSIPATCPATTSVIDPETDDLRPVREIVRARLGKSISPATLWRWIRRGTGGARLEVIRIGGRWMSTDKAFAEFLRVQTANALRDSSSPDPASAETGRTPQKTRQLQRAGLIR
jgi:hypothetical protein